MSETIGKIRKSPIVWIGLLAALAAVYFLFDPMEAKWMPKCMFYVVTGWECPGCGSQRAVHALLHGDIADAFRANAMLLVMIPLLIVLAFLELFGNRGSALYRRLHQPALILAIAAVIILWGVVRNLISI